MVYDTLVRRLQELAKVQPEKTAVVLKKDALSYSELLRRSCAVSALLRQEGVNPGDRVCFSAVSKPEMVVMYLAVQISGGVAVFLDKNATPENMRAIYDEAGSVLLVTDKPMKDCASGCRTLSLKKMYEAEIPESIDPDDILSKFSPASEQLSELLFTSGTTGTPKGVMLTYKAVYNILKNTVEGINLSENDVLLLPLPLNHSFALRVLRAVLYTGATLILQNGFTFAKEVENNITAFHCTAMACVPASYEVMKSQMQDAFTCVLGGLRYIEFSAGSLSIAQRKEITSLLPGVTVYNTWGSSESGGAIFCNVSEIASDDVLCGTLGKVLPGQVQICIQDSEGNTIQSSRDNPGRMVLKGDMQMAGYWNNPKLTADTLRDGWLKTGDLAYLQDGYVFMLGRADDIINVGGEKVSPIEVENIAGQYDGIIECACVAGDDPNGVLGQIPVLFIVCRQEYSEEKFKKFMSAKMERYKIPQKLVKIESLPRNQMQKIDRKKLKDMLSENISEDLFNPVVETIIGRRSIRKFKEQSIEEEKLKMILKCGYYAPSGHNMQTWRFTVLTKQSDISMLKEKTAAAAISEKVYFYGWENPQAIVLISNDSRNNYGCQDASCAAENMMLAALSYGIGSVWLNPLMTLRNTAPVNELLDTFGIPKNHTVWACIAMGYPITSGRMLKKNETVIHYI